MTNSTGITTLGPHHHAWLAAHPNRSDRWLAWVLRMGFDVHHIDGDHSNDAPDNLVLVEAQDHMRLHGMDRLRKLPIYRGKRRPRRTKRKVALAQYEQAKQRLVESLTKPS